MRRLRTDYLDLYQLGVPDPATPTEETLGALSDLVDVGRIRAFGASKVPASQIVEGQWAAQRQRCGRFISEQPPYSLLTRAIKCAVPPTCARYDMGVVSYSALARGWLSGQYRRGNAPWSTSTATSLPTASRSRTNSLTRSTRSSHPARASMSPTTCGPLERERAGHPGSPPLTHADRTERRTTESNRANQRMNSVAIRVTLASRNNTESRRAPMDVKEKVVLITGASEGIGAATARLLAARGAKVAIAARSIDKLNELSGELENSFAVQVDMTQPASITAMVEALVEHYGHIDVLVNNAGRALRARVAEITVADFQSIIDLNLFGPMLAMQAVIPHMRKQGGGSIVNISSNVSKLAIPTIGAYAATKYALNGLTLTARGELAEDGIIVTVMYPGQTATNFGKNAMVDDGMASAPPPSGGSNPSPDTAEDVAERVLEAITDGPAEQYMNPEMEQAFSMRGA